ncbi:methyl-accepting chemotaxis protein [Heyndrickxia vini]|uniref:MCP four helix bundle domain-containing protein n=1 Tax=Heyndrickxia vini TaxID=1476025 RepID=A0ABX7E1V1_9BACI|nr:methyl-accepting chemotaxis protein [Heyndrickxia vini]QQZ09693.1 MCP four helix bundle domain-containing protein [Heyndrickxia vini]
MGLLRNLKISKKLAILIIVELLALLIIGVISLFFMKNIANETEKMFTHRFIPNQWLGKVIENNRAIDEDILELMLTQNSIRKEEKQEDIGMLQKETDNLMKKLLSAKLSNAEQEKIEVLQKSKLELREVREKVITLAQKNINSEAYQLYTAEVLPKGLLVTSALSDLQKLNEKVAAELNKNNKQEILKANMLIILIGLIAMVISTVIGLLITKMIVKPTNHMVKLLSKAENGDFTVKGTYQSKDEIGILTTSFNNMISGLQGIIKTVRDTSQQVAAASEELTASADQTTVATEHVATAIQEIASSAEQSSVKIEENSNSLNEILHGVTRIADSTTNVSELSRETSIEAEEGGKSVEGTLSQMKFIHESVNNLNEVIQTLSNRSYEIGKILDVISGISDQTNLLALNAAIEAARAGEHGKGFAVVADEVRKLAEQSQTSTHSIAKIINSIQLDIKNSLEMMNEVTNNAEQGVLVSVETSKKFKTIIDQTKNIAPQIEEITATVQQISASVEEVSSSAKEVSTHSQENAASSEEVAASTEQQLASMEEINASAKSLASTAEELKELVNKFIVK